MKQALSQLCNVRIGRTPRRDSPQYWGGSAVWVTVRELNGGTLTDSKEHISDLAVSDVMPPPVPAGTLLFSFKLSIGKIGIAGVPLYTNEAIASLEIRDPEQLDRDFLKYALMACASGIEANHAVLGMVLNKAKVEAIELPVPPITEQRRIVDILSRAEGIVQLRCEAQKKAAEIIPALFLDMFGDPATNPKRWAVVPFGSVISPIEFGISAALSKDAHYVPGRIGVLRIANLTPYGTLNLSDIRYLNVSEKKRQQLLLRCDDLLFNWRNSPNWVGKTAIVPYDLDCIFASFLYRFRALPACSDTVFIWFYMNFLRTRGFFEAICRQAVSQANFGRDELAAVEVFNPPLQLQQEFAQTCRAIFAIQSQQAAAIEKATASFQSLLASFFSQPPSERVAT